MSFIKKLFGQKLLDSKLFGNWVGIVDGEDVSMTFTKDGKLIYEINTGGKVQRINMIFETVDNIIISDQPSHPNKEKTKYKFENDRTLLLDFNGVLTRFIKK
jgi:hypothetical protein